MLAYFSKYPQFVELSHLLLNYKKATARNLQRTYGIFFKTYCFIYCSKSTHAISWWKKLAFELLSFVKSLEKVVGELKKRINN